jgi:hypothetical protein
MILDLNWTPLFGNIVTWFAMDKNGRIAFMLNNCFGDVPRVLLSLENLKDHLDSLSEYIFEESEVFTTCPPDKGGETILDMYSTLVYRFCKDRKEVEAIIQERVRSNYGSKIKDPDLPACKGFYVYHGVEGATPGEDSPSDYEGKTEMGDYFRHLMPTIYATIDDIPKELRHIVAASDTVDFTQDRILFNKNINQYFPKTAV